MTSGREFFTAEFYIQPRVLRTVHDFGRGILRSAPRLAHGSRFRPRNFTFSPEACARFTISAAEFYVQPRGLRTVHDFGRGILRSAPRLAHGSRFRPRNFTFSPEACARFRILAAEFYVQPRGLPRGQN